MSGSEALDAVESNASAAGRRRDQCPAAARPLIENYFPSRRARRDLWLRRPCRRAPCPSRTSRSPSCGLWIRRDGVIRVLVPPHRHVFVFHPRAGLMRVLCPAGSGHAAEPTPRHPLRPRPHVRHRRLGVHSPAVHAWRTLPFSRPTGAAGCPRTCKCILCRSPSPHGNSRLVATRDSSSHCGPLFSHWLTARQLQSHDVER